ncbi:MAG: CvpA family protein [Campylobacteraceae bacterium]|jgi:membrane protein required for colicin V production|nr:CvpA family protein [Campylobacteraceae bacterium]
MDFSLFDIIIIVIILLLGIKGFANGFIRELFEFIGIIGGIFLASRFSQKAGVFISNNVYSIENEMAIRIIGFVVLLFVIFAVSILVGIVISKIIKFSGYTNLNKILGFVFSTLTIFFVFSMLTFATSSIEFARVFVTSTLGAENSFMYKKLSAIGEQIVDIHPSKLPSIDNITDKIEPLIEKSNEVVENLGNDINIFISNETNSVE